MPSRIVTSTYRYKRPPRKRKVVPLEGPVVVTLRKRAVLPIDEPKLPPPADPPPPANDDEPAEMAPPPPAARKKSAIVTASKRRRRAKPEPEINPEAEARVKAFLARMMRPP